MRMKRFAAIASAIGAIGAIAAPAASAATPNNQACLGEDFSTFARFGSPGPVIVTEPGSGFGQFNAALAQSVPGLGAPVQFHLAGGLPDSVVINSCNDVTPTG
jgi:hypothetical protein